MGGLTRMSERGQRRLLCKEVRSKAGISQGQSEKRESWEEEMARAKALSQEGTEHVRVRERRPISLEFREQGDSSLRPEGVKPWKP